MSARTAKKVTRSSNPSDQSILYNPDPSSESTMSWESFRKQITSSIQYEEDSIQRQAIRWSNVKRVAMDLVEWGESTGFPNNTHVSIDTSGIQIQVPWGAANLRQTRLALGKSWKYTYTYTSTDGSIYRHYEYVGDKLPYLLSSKNEDPRVQLTISMTTYNIPEGSCKKVEIGETVHVVKKYKIVCGPTK